MKAAEVRLIKSLKSCVSKHFPGYGEFKIDFSDTSKQSGAEKSDMFIHFLITEAPDGFGEEGFANKLKAAFSEAMSVSLSGHHHPVTVPYLKLSVSYSENNVGEGLFYCHLQFRLN